jgi:hypothetical protein
MDSNLMAELEKMEVVEQDCLDGIECPNCGCNAGFPDEDHYWHFGCEACGYYWQQVPDFPDEDR